MKSSGVSSSYHNKHPELFCLVRLQVIGRQVGASHQRIVATLTKLFIVQLARAIENVGDRYWNIW